MSFTIGKLAREAGVGVETIRFYQRRGLLATPPNGGAGYRVYSPETVVRINFIRRAQQLGFTLHEITELMQLEEDQSAPCSGLRARATAKLTTVRDKITDLMRMEDALEHLLQACDGDRQIRDCPIMDCLQSRAGQSDMCLRGSGGEQ
jgi:Hg(II)-responsive transcriptional regulator